MSGCGRALFHNSFFVFPFISQILLCLYFLEDYLMSRTTKWFISFIRFMNSWLKWWSSSPRSKVNNPNNSDDNQRCECDIGYITQCYTKSKLIRSSFPFSPQISNFINCPILYCLCIFSRAQEVRFVSCCHAKWAWQKNSLAYELRQNYSGPFWEVSLLLALVTLMIPPHLLICTNPKKP